jgi:hypothetical protein
LASPIITRTDELAFAGSKEISSALLRSVMGAGGPIFFRQNRGRVRLYRKRQSYGSLRSWRTSYELDLSFVGIDGARHLVAIYGQVAFM